MQEHVRTGTEGHVARNDDRRAVEIDGAAIPRGTRPGVAPSRRAIHVAGTGRAGRRVVPRIDGHGFATGRPGGRMVHELRGVGAAAACLRAGRAGVGERESGVPVAGARVRDPQVANEGAVPVAGRRARELCGDSGSGGRRAEHGVLRPGVRLEDAGRGGVHGKRAGRGEYPVHVGHHGIAEGRAAHASQSAEQRIPRGRADECLRTRPYLPAGSAVSLFRLRDGRFGMRGARMRADPSLLDLRRPRRARSGARRSTAYPRCSSRSSNIRNSRTSICHRCALESWRARRARSR